MIKRKTVRKMVQALGVAAALSLFGCDTLTEEKPVDPAPEVEKGGDSVVTTLPSNEFTLSLGARGRRATVLWQGREEAQEYTLNVSGDKETWEVVSTVEADPTQSEYELSYTVPDTGIYSFYLELESEEGMKSSDTLTRSFQDSTFSPGLNKHGNFMLITASHPVPSGQDHENPVYSVYISRDSLEWDTVTSFSAGRTGAAYLPEIGDYYVQVRARYRKWFVKGNEKTSFGYGTTYSDVVTYSHDSESPVDFLLRDSVITDVNNSMRIHPTTLFPVENGVHIDIGKAPLIFYTSPDGTEWDSCPDAYFYPDSIGTFYLKGTIPTKDHGVLESQIMKVEDYDPIGMTFSLDTNSSRVIVSSRYRNYRELFLSREGERWFRDSMGTSKWDSTFTEPGSYRLFVTQGLSSYSSTIKSEMITLDVRYPRNNTRIFEVSDSVDYVYLNIASASKVEADKIVIYRGGDSSNTVPIDTIDYETISSTIYRDTLSSAQKLFYRVAVLNSERGLVSYPSALEYVDYTGETPPALYINKVISTPFGMRINFQKYEGSFSGTDSIVIYRGLAPNNLNAIDTFKLQESLFYTDSLFELDKNEIYYAVRILNDGFATKMSKPKKAVRFSSDILSEYSVEQNGPFVTIKQIKGDEYYFCFRISEDGDTVLAAEAFDFYSGAVDTLKSPGTYTYIMIDTDGSSHASIVSTHSEAFTVSFDGSLVKPNMRVVQSGLEEIKVTIPVSSYYDSLQIYRASAGGAFERVKSFTDTTGVLVYDTVVVNGYETEQRVFRYLDSFSGEPLSVQYKVKGFVNGEEIESKLSTVNYNPFGVYEPSGKIVVSDGEFTVRWHGELLEDLPLYVTIALYRNGVMVQEMGRSIVNGDEFDATPGSTLEKGMGYRMRVHEYKNPSNYLESGELEVM